MGSTFFFKGWFQDHQNKSVVLGEKGFKSWIENEEYDSPILDTDFEGSYVSAVFHKGEFVVRNDMFSYLPVIHFSTQNLFVCSDSLFIISEVRKALGMSCKLNKNVMYSRAWTHGLASAVMSNQTQIEGVELLSPGKHIKIKTIFKIFHLNYILDSENIVKSSDLKQTFAGNFENYEQAIRDAATKMVQSILSFTRLEEIIIQFGLSGGLDSRIILAALLQKPEVLERIVIKTNTHASRKGDFDVVKELSELFNFEFNDTEKIRLHSASSLGEQKIPDQFALWVLSSMGLFDMMYLHDSYWPTPSIIEMGGHGAETIKGTFAPMRFDNLVKNHPIIAKAKYSSKSLPRVKSDKKVHDAIRSEISEALATSGIDLDEYASMQWHHLCYKSPIQNGSSRDCSSIALRPFIQHSLFALAISEINPFKNNKRGEPTILHDILILLNPELAEIDFEDPKTNVSKEYIQSRLDALGGPLRLLESEPYSIHGSIKEMTNGPPEVFLKMVNHDFRPDGNDAKSILGALERAWDKITDKEVKSAYLPAYETAKEKMKDTDAYTPGASGPAAKIISLSLLDQQS